MNLIDCNAAFDTNCDGLYVVRKQDITSDFMDELKCERHAKAAIERPGAMNRVARVPAFVWELWERQGREPMRASARQIVNWLERDDLNDFVVTPKNV